MVSIGGPVVFHLVGLNLHHIESFLKYQNRYDPAVRLSMHFLSYQRSSTL